MTRIVLAAPLALVLAACSAETTENAEETLERAAADTEANAEVVGNEIREGAIVAADNVAEGAENLSEELSERDAANADDGDGELDGTE